jgi:flagellar secretion chaperone FliS
VFDVTDGKHMKAPTPNAYLRTKVMTASPAELRLMLLDGAIRFAEQAKTGLAAKDFEACYVGTTRCQAILMELINGLRPEHDPQLCERLSALYTYMYTQMVKASSERKVELIDEVIKLLSYERETWTLLLDQLAQENRAAKSMKSTPAASPAQAIGPGVPAKNLVGGIVSLQG